MFDIGWSELILIGVVALIVIGPQDLPDMFRQLGRFTAKLRSMSRDFTRAMEQAANESGVKDVAKDLKSATSTQGLGLNAMRDAASKFEKWDPLKNAATPARAAVVTTAPAASGTTAAQAAAAKPPVGPETQALLDKQAERQAIIAESTERLRAVNGSGRPAVAAQTPQVQPMVEAEAPAKPKSRAKPAKTADPDAPTPVRAAAKRKPKKADEA